MIKITDDLYKRIRQTLMLHRDMLEKDCQDKRCPCLNRVESEYGDHCNGYIKQILKDLSESEAVKP